MPEWAKLLSSTHF